MNPSSSIAPITSGTIPGASDNGKGMGADSMGARGKVMSASLGTLGEQHACQEGDTCSMT
jgi:hypothetical protein